MSSSVKTAASGAGSTLKSGAATLGGIAGIGGVADILEGNGLDKAEAAAGDVLRPIFGGVPWEMSADEIVDAVVPDFLPDFIPGAAKDAAEAVPGMIDVTVSLL